MTKKSGFNKKGRCKLCKEPRTPEGHDPCIANLPGVSFACCGHGIDKGYIKFTDGRILDFLPLSVELDEATHVVVQTGVAGRITGSPYRVLNFITKKVKKKRDRYGIDSIESIRIDVPTTIRRRPKSGDRKSENR